MEDADFFEISYINDGSRNIRIFLLFAFPMRPVSIEPYKSRIRFGMRLLGGRAGSGPLLRVVVCDGNLFDARRFPGRTGLSSSSLSLPGSDLSGLCSMSIDWMLDARSDLLLVGILGGSRGESRSRQCASAYEGLAGLIPDRMLGFWARFSLKEFNMDWKPLKDILFR